MKLSIHTLENLNAELASQIAWKERYMRELLQAGERIRELEAAIRDCCSDMGCFGNLDEACCITDEPIHTWCGPCKLSTYLGSPPSTQTGASDT